MKVHIGAQFAFTAFVFAQDDDVRIYLKVSSVQLDHENSLLLPIS